MAGPEKFDEILDSVSYRFRAAAARAFNGGLSIQNVAGTLCQVDDLGNVTPLIGGTIGGITAITGDVVATGPGVVNSVIQPGRVTYAKIQNVSDAVLLGNNSGGAASVQELTKGQVISFLGLAAIATSGSAGDLTSGTLPAGRFPALTGDVTTVAGSLVTTVNIPAAQIPFGDASNHMTSGKLTWDNAGQALAVIGKNAAGINKTLIIDNSGPHVSAIAWRSGGRRILGTRTMRSGNSPSPTAPRPRMSEHLISFRVLRSRLISLPSREQVLRVVPSPRLRRCSMSSPDR